MPDVLIDARIFGNGVNFSGRSNKVELSIEAEEFDATVFEPDNPADAGWRARRGTVLDSKAAFSGFWTAGDPSKVDNALWSQLGTVNAWSFVRGKGAPGDICWFTQALTAKYQVFGDYGKPAPFDGAISGSWPLIRGTVAHPHTTARSANGAGVDVPFTGAVPAGQYLYAALQVVSVAGTATPTLSVVVESDSVAGFTAPVQRLAFAPATGIGAQVARVAGPFTDTHFRVRWTVAGTSPSFLFCGALGVAPA
ncbi:hypothetical protein [Actinoplanes lobatus]|nr:hypothetical protein [Actinoplanes lobatus]MBB4747749.1 hypothetical protein [Actinoplanes lobatus]